MNDAPRETLRQLLQLHGLDLAADPRRVRGLMLDLCGDCRAEINLLVQAQEAGVPERLLQQPGNAPIAILVAQLSRHLEELHFIATPASRWAVEAWAFALGLDSVQPTTSLPNQKITHRGAGMGPDSFTPGVRSYYLGDDAQAATAAGREHVPVPALGDGVLDADQRSAVDHRGAHLLIIAGAGSGKTRTLAYRAISLLSEMRPENLMVVTFTKKAAREISNRIADSVTEEVRRSLKRAWIGTLHSICWRILMESGHLVGLQTDWSVLDLPDSERVMRISAAPFGLADKARDILALYSYARNSQTDWRSWLRTQRFPNLTDERRIGQTLESYARRCRRSNRVDFDDLQVLTLRLLQDEPGVRQLYRDRLKAILVDEYQDTNTIQESILRQLAGRGNVTVVGDDAQAIYGFRAATVENILSFRKEYRADMVTIGTNYRSTSQIVELADESIRHNQRQIPKQLRAAHGPGSMPQLYGGATIADEATFIVDRIQRHLRQGVKLHEIAVLFRATRLSAQVALGLGKAGLPFVVVGGEDFFGLEHVKYVLDVVRLLANPEDAIALSSVQSLIGFGTPETLEHVERQAEQGQMTFWDMAAQTRQQVTSSDRKDYDGLLGFRRVLEEFRATSVDGQPITPTVGAIIRYLTPYLQRKPGTAWVEASADLDVLLNVAAQFTALSDFSNNVLLQQFVEEEREGDTKPLVLSTIHSAKGQEWRVVFVIGLVEFWFPLRYAIQQSGTDEEERRLFYVAVTRAKEHLYLTHYKQSVNQYGKVFQQGISRFVKELPLTVYETTTR